MPLATKKKHVYAKVARHPVRSKPRPTAWRGTAEDVVRDCFASREAPFGELKTPRSQDAAGAAILILHERGIGLGDIARVVGRADHSSAYYALQAYTARLFAEDRARPATIVPPSGMVQDPVARAEISTGSIPQRGDPGSSPGAGRRTRRATLDKTCATR